LRPLARAEGLVHPGHEPEASVWLFLLMGTLWPQSHKNVHP